MSQLFHRNQLVTKSILGFLPFIKNQRTYLLLFQKLKFFKLTSSEEEFCFAELVLVFVLDQFCDYVGASRPAKKPIQQKNLQLVEKLKMVEQIILQETNPTKKLTT